MREPRYLQQPTAVADAIIDRVGPDLVMALPLGLGKANHVANALYDRVAADPGLSLTILTALTLEKPGFNNELERRFMAPVVERLFAGYPELHYAPARKQGKLPANIRVEEFFFLAGSQLGAPVAQQDHICANYTHALGYLLDRGVNVLAQLVAENPANPAASRFSASCNADLTADMLMARRSGKADFLFVGEVNDELPFMSADALLDEAEFGLILRSSEYQFPLFAPPRMPVPATEYAAALHVARLVPDGGTLQIGIGSLGDAVAHCLSLRHSQNQRFCELVAAVTAEPLAAPFAHLSPFETGLHGLSEMLVEGFLHLYDAGILKREVDGKVLNAAFFLGSREFYSRLRRMDEATREKFAMRSIHFTNQLYGGVDAKRISRTAARFVNKAMMVTLRGEVVSDALEDGRVVSGVGGQFDFAVQAFALERARYVIVVPATRRNDGEILSNIRWSYGNTTVPRHLRDLVVTEYGIADLRGKTDAQVIAAMLSVTDARFQDELLETAKSAGKIAAGFTIPETWRRNTPAHVEEALGEALADGALPRFPLGTEFDDTEQELMAALATVKEVSFSRARLLGVALKGLAAPRDDRVAAGLTRMELASPGTSTERFLQLLLRGGYRMARKPGQL